MSVNADLLIPNDSVFSFEDNEQLITLLEEVVDKNILLNLRIQTIIEPISKDQTDDEQQIRAISDQLVTELASLNDSYKISSVSVTQNLSSEGWIVNAEILSDPELVPTGQSLVEIDDNITQAVKEEIELNLTFLPRLTLRTNDQTVSQETRKAAERITRTINQGAELSSFALTQNDNLVTVAYTVISVDNTVFDELYLNSVKQELQQIVDKDVSLRVRLVTATDIAL
jgi:hypothetical protein